MADDDTLADAILTNAQAPREYHGDSGGASQHPLADQIAAARYLANRAAMADPRTALRRVRLVPPGAV